VNKTVIATAFGEVLRGCRRNAEFSQEYLAQVADIDRTYPSLLERGLREPTLGVVISLGRALGIDSCTLVRMTVSRAEQTKQAAVPDPKLNSSRGTGLSDP
jgi:transcriptional regulator with XRE-family HTH domain